MGIVLLAFVCVLHSDDCRPQVIAAGFVHPNQCSAYSPLMVAGWEKLHPGIEIRRKICTDRPEFIIGKFQS